VLPIADCGIHNTQQCTSPPSRKCSQVPHVNPSAAACALLQPVTSWEPCPPQWRPHLNMHPLNNPVSALITRPHIILPTAHSTSPGCTCTSHTHKLTGASCSTTAIPASIIPRTAATKRNCVHTYWLLMSQSSCRWTHTALLQKPTQTQHIVQWVSNHRHSTGSVGCC
jgi:hypothetical protein